MQLLYSNKCSFESDHSPLTFDTFLFQFKKRGGKNVKIFRTRSTNQKQQHNCRWTRSTEFCS